MQLVYLSSQGQILRCENPIYIDKILNNSLSINRNTHAHGCCLKATKSNCIIYGFNPIIETMTIVHSEAPWGQPQEERLAPKERTHPMRPLSRNNNTTTRLKRGPNPLSGILIPRPPGDNHNKKGVLRRRGHTQ